MSSIRVKELTNIVRKRDQTKNNYEIKKHNEKEITCIQRKFNVSFVSEKLFSLEIGHGWQLNVDEKTMKKKRDNRHKSGRIFN